MVRVDFKSLTYRKEKSWGHVTMVAKFLDLNKLWSFKYGRKTKTTEKLSCLTLLCMIALRNKTVVHTFFYRSTMQMAVSVKKRLLRAWNFATMATWRHTSPLYYHAVWLLDRSNYTLLIISNTESAIGVTERGKISMHGNKNIIMLSNFQIFRSDWMLGWES